MGENEIQYAGQGDGVSGIISRRDLALARRAFREGWPITPEIRQEVVGRVLGILRAAKSPSRQLCAARVLIAADALNVRREANDVQESTAESTSVRDVAARLLATAEGRDLAARQAALL